jgi:hypothetical protein
MRFDWFAQPPEASGPETLLGDFSELANEQCLLFIGTEIGVFGAENRCKTRIAEPDLLMLMETTNAR